MKETKTIAPIHPEKGEHVFFTKRSVRGNPFIQPKLTIGPVDDAYEREADAVADSVLQKHDDTPIPNMISPVNVQRKCAHCEEEEKLQRKEEGGNPGPLEAPSSVHDVIGSVGKPLDDGTRSFMENRFGYDFGNVNIHTDAVAAKSAQAINALAYTSGNHIVFNEGRYAPDTASGKHLLAHELTHVIQQGNSVERKTIQRCPDPASTALFDTRAAEVRAHAEFTALSSADRTMAEEIITLSRNREDCVYLIGQLLALFNTPVDLSPAVGAAASATMANAADQERARLATPEGRRLQDVEERMSSSANFETLSPPARSWGHMATFQMDRSDPHNIVVRARIRVTGNSTDVANIVAQEDGIEKAAQELGYTLDVIFVNTSGPNVFTVSVNPAAAVTAGNWSAYSADPSAYTHEIHHLLGLEDRYDYTVHAHNTRMPLHDRLHWFRVHVGRSPDPLGEQSLMGSGSHLLDDDICRVTQLNFASCMASRQARRDMINNARSSAFIKCFKVFQTLSLIRPPSPFGDSQYRLEQQRALSMAHTIFGGRVSLQQVTDIVSSMRHRLTTGIPLRYAPSADSNCSGNATYVVNMIPPIAICPDFFVLSAEDQVRSFLRSAAQLVRMDNRIPVSVCADNSCDTPCGGFNNADTWAKFIWCAAAI